MQGCFLWGQSRRESSDCCWVGERGGQKSDKTSAQQPSGLELTCVPVPASCRAGLCLKPGMAPEARLLPAFLCHAPGQQVLSYRGMAVLNKFLSHVAREWGCTWMSLPCPWWHAFLFILGLHVATPVCILLMLVGFMPCETVSLPQFLNTCFCHSFRYWNVKLYSPFISQKFHFGQT